MCDCDCDPPEFYHATDRTARKSHRCSECRRTIAVGESYVEHSGKWDGRMATFRQCDHCAAAVQVLSGLIDDFCVCFGGLWDDMIDHEYYGRPNRVLTRLRAGAKRKWTHRRGPKAGQLMPVPPVPSPPPVPAPASS